ncbi:MAG: hypothetical protein KC420_02675 [Myxococcales bacterium]|nr:hypothetical protein [Myxococcales bacterium]MCB9565630.1 hypothetical protein [Myxococcales bacterium]MCB9703214.1 hypothetical protein [Myxococcales bacterium]
MNGKSVDMAASVEDDATENVMRYFGRAVDRFREGRRKEVVQWLLQSESTEDMLRRVDELRRGTWRDDLALGASALAGLGLGHFAGSKLPAKLLGPLPFISLFGLVGVLPALWSNETQTVRSVFGLGGLLFGAGAVLGAGKE